MGETIKEEDQAVIILNGLPDQFKEMRTVIMYSRDTLTLEDVMKTENCISAKQYGLLKTLIHATAAIGNVNKGFNLLCRIGKRGHVPNITKHNIVLINGLFCQGIWDERRRLLFLSIIWYYTIM
ncbi:hypothetical protein F8388_015044 [Cannabis sativa]|uniref:Uncharacterized protein n=1 Tax=Cannabis sativa TaxID=3483 RepID=A0A7J6EKN3_CANSA|nr:hypothetical protein F8388_015044 [Cannabis sativa]